MRILLAPLLLAVSLPAFAEVDSKIHKLCIGAKDYAGCVRAMKGSNQESAKTTIEKCWGSGLEKTCLAESGVDRLGLPKITGWFYNETAEGVLIYTEADLNYIRSNQDPGHTSEMNGMPHSKYYFIPHKGQKRYIALNQVERMYDKGQVATSGTNLTFGTAQTNCSSSNYSVGSMISGSINCISNPAPSFNIPGKKGRNPGVISARVLKVFDCKDKTFAYYLNGKLKGNWNKAAEGYISDCNDIVWDKTERVDFKL